MQPGSPKSKASIICKRDEIHRGRPVAYGLALFIRQNGHDAIHTDDLPNRERTTDTEIRRIAASETRIVISKDKDFVDSHLLQQQPARLLWVATGNIVNRELFDLFRTHWPEIERKLQQTETCLWVLNNENFVEY